MLKDWFQIIRIQAAPYFVIFGLSAFFYASTPDLLFTILVITALALIEWAYFGHNSVMDAVMGYDFKDEHKEHHPLIEGRVSFNQGIITINRFKLAVIVFIVMITLVYSPAPGFALAFALIGLTGEEIYNDGISKESKLGFLDCSLGSFGLIGWPWFLNKDYFNEVFFIMLLYCFLAIVFQTILGHVKDFKIDTEHTRSNILADLGAKIDEKNYYNCGNSIIFLAIKIAQIMMIYFLAWEILKVGAIEMILTVCLIVVMVSIAIHNFSYQEYNNHKMTALNSLEGAFAVYVLLSTVITADWMVLTIILSQAFFILSNILTWGSAIQKV